MLTRPENQRSDLRIVVAPKGLGKIKPLAISEIGPAEPVEREPEVKPERKTMIGSRPRLLLIEDNEGDIFLIKRALQENNISAEVSVCKDGESALRALDSSPPDAIILDLALPRIDGLDVLRKVLQRPSYVGTPIMVFTSSPSPSDKHRVELLAGPRYVQKPSGLDNFLREVAENVKSMFSKSTRHNRGSKGA